MTGEISILGTINENMTRAVFKQLHEQRDADELNVVVDTNGGSYLEAMVIHCGIKNHGAKTKRAFLRHCHSGGMLVAMACDIRVARAGSEVSFHLSALSDPGLISRWTASECRRAAENLAEADEEMVSLFAERTGADPALIREVAEADKTMPLEWLCANGFIHEVTP